MDKASPKHKKLAQALILTVAACTLFWHYPQLQFTHDELSALFKTELPTFEELIEKGVKVEGHPAGVEVFLYYYAPLVKYNLWALKLPFSLMAIASILIIFAIGKTIKQEAAALYTGAIMAVSQYFIYYGQIVRPYEAGLFFSLLSALFWLRYFHQEAHYKNLIGFALSAAAAAYSHQFALLLVGIMGLHALIISSARGKFEWLLCGLLTFLLYVPHLNIFFHQLSLGGVGSWLAKPQLSFPLSYLAYIFHFSYLFIGAVIIALLIPKWQLKKAKNWEGLIWFCASFLIGFFYSRQINPVLQYSTLLFAAPLLLLSLFALRQMRLQWLSLLLILGTGLYSLYADRYHYPLVYQSPFKYPRGYVAKNDLSNSALITNLDRGKWDFYARLDDYNSDENYYYQDPKELAKYLATSTQSEIVLALDHHGSAFIPAIINESGFNQIRKEDHLGFTLFHFAKNQKPRESKAGISVRANNIRCEASQGYCGQISLELEAAAIEGSQDYVLAQFELEEVPLHSQAQLIIAYFSQDELIHWSNRPLSEFQSDSSFTVFHSQVLPSDWQEYPNLEARAMIETKGEAMLIKKSLLSLVEGNNLIYGINQPFNLSTGIN